MEREDSLACATNEHMHPTWQKHSVTKALFPQVIELLTGRTWQLLRFSWKQQQNLRHVSATGPRAKQAALKELFLIRQKLLGDIISKELKALESFVKEHNPTYNIDLSAQKFELKTAIFLFRKQCHTVLQYDRNFGEYRYIYESIQHAILRGSYSWWIILLLVLRQGTFLNAISRLEDLKAVRQLYKREKETSSMEILYDKEVWDKRSPFYKKELYCHKASTELLTFQNIKIRSPPTQLMSILFLLQRMRQRLRHTRKVTRWSSNRGRVRPWIRFWRSYSGQWRRRCFGWFCFQFRAVKTRIAERVVVVVCREW